MEDQFIKFERFQISGFIGDSLFEFTQVYSCFVVLFVVVFVFVTVQFDGNVSAMYYRVASNALI